MSNNNDGINWHNLQDRLTPIQQVDLAMRLIATAPDDAGDKVLGLANDLANMLGLISEHTFKEIRRQIKEDIKDHKELLIHSLVNLGKLDPHE